VSAPDGLVHGTGEPRPPATYAHGHHASVLSVHRQRDVSNSAAYLVDDLCPGRSVLDVGCGPGTITVDIAGRVAPGRVVGIDAAGAVLDEARRHAVEIGVDVDFEVGDVYALDAADDSFDIVHAHQVLQHLADPVAALREMRRVCRPGGVVAVREVDYASAVSVPDVVTDWLSVYETMARRGGGEPNAGRRLLGWAREAGLDDVDCGADCWCFWTPAERAWWGGAWAERAVSSSYAVASVQQGVSTPERNREIARRWRAWVEAPDGWFAITHGWVRARG
jgi:SAM-dependent methyltransferase